VSPTLCPVPVGHEQPCESVTTCQEPSRWIATNSAGDEFHLCHACAACYLPAATQSVTVPPAATERGRSAEHEQRGR
jgi:MinD superfamily P-loop ATPase